MERLTPVEQKAPGAWQVGTVTAIKRETPRVKSFRVALAMWMPHLLDGVRALRSGVQVVGGDPRVGKSRSVTEM